MIVGFKLKSLTIHSFGGITEYDELLNVNVYKEIFVIIAGPLIQVLFYLLIFSIYKEGYINITTFDKFHMINKILLSINLLPIIPLDGGILLNRILDIFMPYKYSYIISIIISFICLPVIIINLQNLLGIILVIFLIFKLINEIKMLKYRFNKFLLERYTHTFNLRKGKIINNINLIRRTKESRIKKDSLIYDEKEYLRNFVFT